MNICALHTLYMCMHHVHYSGMYMYIHLHVCVLYSAILSIAGKLERFYWLWLMVPLCTDSGP